MEEGFQVKGLGVGGDKGQSSMHTEHESRQVSKKVDIWGDHQG